MKIMSFNTQHCLNFYTRKIDFDIMADAINKCKPDIVGLNEMFNKGVSKEYTDQAAELSRLTGLKYHYFAEAINEDGDPYGNAILSRYPIIAAETIAIPDPNPKKYNGYYETRCILKVKLENGYTVLVSHFGLNPDEQENAVKTVIKNLEKEKCILMGDFNVKPQDAVLNPLREKLKDTADLFNKPLLSFPSDKPNRKIDYIFVTPDVKLLSADIPAIVASDHRPHTAEIDFNYVLEPNKKSEKVRNITATVCEDANGKHYVKVVFCANNDFDVIIKKKEITDYNRETDSSEFFDDIVPTDDDIIFDGKLERVNSYETYCDYDVEIDKIYAYFVTTHLKKDTYTGPAPVKVRDQYVFWSYDKITKEINDLQEFDGVKTVTVGETVNHRKLTAVCAGNTENAVALFGAVHPGEAGAELCIGVLKNILKNNPELLKKNGIIVLPSVNADIREKFAKGLPWYLRKNVNEVDLNRNFDSSWDKVEHGYGFSSDDSRSPTYRGMYPNSESETKAVVNLLDTFKPKVALSFHALSSITGDSMLCAEKGKEDAEYLKRVEKVVRLYKEGFRRAAGVPMNDRIIIPEGTSGSFIAYGYDKGILAFDLELHRGSGLDWLEGCKIDKTSRAILDECIEYHTEALVNLLKNFDTI